MTATAMPPRPPPRRIGAGGWAWVRAILADRSLRSILIAAFTALVIGTAGAVGLLSRQAGQQAVITLADRLLADIADRIDQRLARDLAGLQYVVDTNAVLIRQGRLDPRDAAGLERYFAAQLTLTGLSEFLQGLRVGANGQAFLVDRAGLLVATSTGEMPFERPVRAARTDNVAVADQRLPAVASADPLTRAAARQLLAAPPSHKESAAPLHFDFNGRRYLAKVTSSPAGLSHPDWLTVVVAPQRDFTALLALPVHQWMLFAGLALVIAVLLGLVTARAISRPLGPFSGATRRLAERTAERAAAAARDAQTLVQVSASEAKFRAVFEQSPAGIALIDPVTGRVLEINEGLLRIIGRTREEVLAQGWTGVTHPDDLPMEFAQVARLRAGEIDGFQIEKRYLREDGPVIWADLRVATVSLGADDPQLHLCLVADITARKQAETQVRKSEQRYRLLTETMRDIVWVLDPERVHLDYVSPSCRHLYGYTADELMTLPADHMLAPQARGLLLETLFQRYTAFVNGHYDEDHFFTDELPYLHKDGNPGWVEAITHFMRNAGTGRVELHGVSRNISDRKQLEERLRISEEQYRLLADNASDLISVFDPDGRAIYISPSVERLCGYTQAEALQQSLEEKLTAEGAAIARAGLAQTRAAIQAGLPLPTFRGDLEHQRKDGSTVWAEVSTTCLLNAAGDYLGTRSAARDISERKRHERELAQARDAAEAANRAKSAFLAHMSHEIRTPMNIVLGLAQVLSRAPLTADQNDMVERIRTAGESLLAIINDILDLAKIEADELRLERHPLLLETLLTRLEGLMAPTALAKGLGFRVEAPPAPLGPLLGDALRLEQVLVNLMGNAVKFTERGEVSLCVCALHSDAVGVGMRFEVRDTGIGIPPEALGGLFTPFTQAEEGITRRFGGTGLGLSISKRLVALMGGEIGVASARGQGSTFWVELSFQWAAEDETGVPTAAPDRPSPSAGPRLVGVHVLVVDDSPMNRDLVERALALEGASATLAADGHQAIERLAAGPADFDAVLMDVRMPVMDGLTATRLIRGQLGLTEIPVIALTAGVLADQQAAARAAGVDDILAKPLDLEQLAVLLTQWVNPRPSARAAAPATRAGQAAAPVTAGDAAGEFPDIAGIDRARAAAILGHNRDLFLWLLKRVADEFGAAAAQTRQDLAAGERDGAARRMHSLRSNAGSLGALDLMAVAADLEAAIDRGETDLEARIADLGRLLADLLAADAPCRDAAAATTPADCVNPTKDALALTRLLRNVT